MQLLAAVLADVESLQRRVERVETALAGVDDGIEAMRVSLGALREVVRGAREFGL
ncbi:hypothetical protein [Phytoactinopolyspora mesophila]|uniref:Uncharacterized protein n=1 Tax=Phytoactinopolyspora mesophila TaxID=2650750 RepID=A0A7K3M3N0_9ACTN|nr:hypothetical protein [Phytoactinopolyspora mesophila]NDL57820.1 hypothetical protein [Phytoactinopolyspora mesophila]